MAAALPKSTATVTRALLQCIEASRASALAAHAAAGLSIGAGQREAARLLRAAEALSRSAAACLQAPALPAATGLPVEPPTRQPRRRRRRKTNESKKKDEQPQETAAAGMVDLEAATMCAAAAGAAAAAAEAAEQRLDELFLQAREAADGPLGDSSRAQWHELCAEHLSQDRRLLLVAQKQKDGVPLLRLQRLNGQLLVSALKAEYGLEWTADLALDKKEATKESY